MNVSGKGPPFASGSPGMAGGARIVLRRLQELMACRHGGKDQLHGVVTLIANSMLSDVCALYLRSRDGSYPLAAGSEQQATTDKHFAAVESHVGTIARTAQPLVINDANHGGGDDLSMRSFLGVPILRGGQVLGVLTAHSFSRRAYDNEEIEVLQTIAMVLAETAAASGDVLLVDSVLPSEMLAGKTLNDGLVVGPAHLHDPVVPATRLLAADLAGEAMRLEEALDALRVSIDSMLKGERIALYGESRDVLETFRLFAYDRSWEKRLTEAVRSGLTAEAAVDRVRHDHWARLGNARDPYLRERLHDLEDLENRLLRHLSGKDARDAPVKGSILVAGRIGPADLLDYHNTGLAGVVLEEAGTTSHVAIIARALAVPALGGVDGLAGKVDQGDDLIVDTDAACVHIRPSRELLANTQTRIMLSGASRASDDTLRHRPAVTRDGVRVELLINAGLPLDLDRVEESGADGIGLFRTEFQFMTSGRIPRLSEQISYYRAIIEQMKDKPLVFRTLDLGGDKIAGFMRSPPEANPAMGMRALRLALEYPRFTRRQLRALIRAGAGRTLSMMFPMVASISEFEAGRALVDKEIEWARTFNHPLPRRVLVGAMVEIPAFALAIRALKGRADFLSVGTNDLMQFLYGADRHNERVFRRYDLLSAPVLDVLTEIRAGADASGTPISVCGESAGDGLEAAVLVALGYRSLSLRAGRIGPVKRILRSLDVGELGREIRRLQASHPGEIRNALLKYLRYGDALR